MNPIFSEKLYVGRPNIGNREKLLARINDMLDRRWLSNDGPFVLELEQRLAEYIGVKHCITMCNGTVALEIAARGLGLKGEVIVPSFTFVATAHALQWQEITPVFCDIDPVTHTINPACIEKMITPRTTGIVGVHLWGRPCNVDKLQEIASRHGLKLMFDASHAFGCSYQGEMIGRFGDAEVFSFHATKFFNTFEGGAIATNDDELAEKVRLMKNFGFVNYDQVDYVGINGKMTEVCAAMGLTNLDSIDTFLECNYRNYKSYMRELENLPGLSLLKYEDGEKHNYQYITVEVDKSEFGMSRDELVAALHSNDVLARKYFYPGCHRMEPYKSFFPQAGTFLPETEQLVTRVMSLPTGTSVSEENVKGICEIIRGNQLGLGSSLT